MRKINWAKLERKIDYKKKYERANKRANKWKKMSYSLKDRLDSLTGFCNELSTEKFDISIRKIRLQSRLDNETKKKNFWRLVSWLLLIALFLIVVL